MLDHCHINPRLERISSSNVIVGFIIQHITPFIVLLLIEYDILTLIFCSLKWAVKTLGLPTEQLMKMFCAKIGIKCCLT